MYQHQYQCDDVSTLSPEDEIETETETPQTPRYDSSKWERKRAAFIAPTTNKIVLFGALMALLCTSVYLYAGGMHGEDALFSTVEAQVDYKQEREIERRGKREERREKRERNLERVAVQEQEGLVDVGVVEERDTSLDYSLEPEHGIEGAEFGGESPFEIIVALSHIFQGIEESLGRIFNGWFNLDDLESIGSYPPPIDSAYDASLQNSTWYDNKPNDEPE